MDLNEEALLDELAAGHGIEGDYYDIFGQRHIATAETKRAILASMGVAADSVAALAYEVGMLRDAGWIRACDPVLIQRGTTAGTWSFRMPVNEEHEPAVAIRWSIRNEDGREVGEGTSQGERGPVETRIVGGQRYLRFEFPLPAGLDLGYYDLEAEGITPSRRVKGALFLIIAPDRCYEPDGVATGTRYWGVACQLYALRTPQCWGVGDFGDLRAWAEWAGKDLGAHLIGLNPVHALKNSRPYHISPYSPDSRLYLNTLYLDVEAIPEFKESLEAQHVFQDSEFQSQLEAMRKRETVDYDHVVALKRRILEPVFQTFERQHFRQENGGLYASTDRGRAFQEYCRSEGPSLEAFALFQALHEEFVSQSPSLSIWQQWPDPYRQPESAACREFLASHHDRVRLHQFMQWMAHEQLAAATRRTQELGMSVGLYHDLALGSDRGGTDAWMYQSVFALGADCGCPPDAFAPDGQNWGLPPLNPQKLRATRYGLFIELLRKNARYGGAIRLDHVMALFRLFWIPRGMPASAGTYVRYPAEELLAILALESVRLKTMIIGEDLGTVPEFIRERLAEAGVLSYRVFYFERTQEREWKAPGDYPRHALAVVTTHDLPTLAGFWSGADVELRRRLGLYRDEDAWAALEERQQDKLRILRALERERLIDTAGVDQLVRGGLTAELRDAIHTYLARSPSALMLVTLEDLLGEVKQVNLPGTLDSYPNWSHKSTYTLGEARRDPRAWQLAAAVRSVRP